MPALSSLLLLPGLLCDAALWQNQINGLKSLADCTVPDTTGADSVQGIASSILASSPPRFALAGLSMGGYLAFEMLRQAPDRVTHLAICDSSARPDTPGQQDRRRLLIGMSQHGQFRGVTPRLLPMLVHPSRTDDPALIDIITGMALRIGRDGFVRQQTAILNRPDSRPLLPTIACPTLVIGGAQDAITPPDLLREIADGISQADLHLLDDCGHLSALEQPDRVTALMRDWLAR